MAKLYRYAVGELYQPEQTEWMEGVDLSIGADGAELRLFLEDPTEAEILSVQTGKAKYAWIEGEHSALLCYRFSLPDGDGIPWSDEPYHATREHPDRRIHREASGPMPARTLLVDASTGILRAVRLQSWPARAADIIRATTRRQIDRGSFSLQAEREFIDGVRRRYPNWPNRTLAMVHQRADITWTGDDTNAIPATPPQAPRR